MNDSFNLSLDNVLEESPTGSLLEGPGGLEALFEGGDDVSCAFLQHIKIIPTLLKGNYPPSIKKIVRWRN